MIFRLIIGFIISFGLSANLFAETRDVSNSSDSGSLVFSSSHTSGSIVRKREGTIVIEVHTFFPILGIKINDRVIEVDPTTSAVIEHDYNLKEGQNIFQVTVQTEMKEEISEIVLVYNDGKTAEEGKSSFMVIGILGVQNISNVYSVPDDQSPEEGTKLQGILVPQFNYGKVDDGKIRIQSVILREKFNNEDQKSKETQFTQLTVSWIEKTGILGTVQLGVGWNDIWSENDQVVSANQHDETDLFLVGSSIYELSKSTSLDVRLNIKDKKMHEEPISVDYDEDATVTDLSAKLSVVFFSSFSSFIKLDTQDVNADGKYKDNAANSMELNAEYRFAKLKVSGGMKYKTQGYKIKDPLVNETVENIKSRIKIKCLFPLSKNTIISGNIIQETQSSNVESNEYLNNTIGLSLMYVFR